MLISEIETAFAGVTREGGVSWSEADAIDGGASEAECAAARASDVDRCWQDVVNDARHDPRAAPMWCFLDPIGVRYYLAAAMVRALKLESADNILSYELSPSTDNKGRVTKHWLRQWSGLDDRQCRCVALFLRYMDAKWFAQYARNVLDLPQELNDWKRALEEYWHKFG